MGENQEKLKSNTIKALQAERTPYLLIWNGFLLLILLLQLGVPSAQGQSTVVADIRCAKVPPNVELFRRAIEKQVELAVDPETYSNIKVHARLAQIGRTKNRTLVDGTDLLNGLTISVEGVTATLAGTVSYSTACDFPFRARIKIRSTDIATGTRRTSSADSFFTITQAGEKIVKRVRIIEDDGEDDES